MTWPIVALVAVVALFVSGLVHAWVVMRMQDRARALRARGQHTIEIKVLGTDEAKRQLEELRAAAEKVNAAVARAHRREDPSNADPGDEYASAPNATLN